MKRLEPDSLAAAPPIGHNRPPADVGWAAFCWRKAQAEAWKSPPIEVVRRRCQMADRLGLTYRDLTAVLLDRGTYLAAVAIVDPAPPDAAKLKKLKPGAVMLIARNPAAMATARAVAAQAGEVVRDIARATDGDALRAAILERGLKPDATALVGPDQHARAMADAAGLARFIWSADYFR